MGQDKGTPIVSVANLSKAFSGKVVVSDVSFDIYPGEIIALVGENGAGKSTTKNMLCGLLKPNSGKIFIDGKEIKKIVGIEHGIGVVHQELSLFGSLTVAANICISDMPGRPNKVDWKEADEIAKKQLDALGIDIDPSTIVSTLGTGKQQLVEIAKALRHSSKMLILDEPTTSLTAPEREKLFVIMNKLKAQGISIIFISHYMDEIYKVSDKYIILRDGKQVDSGYVKDLPQRKMEELMVGRTIADSVLDIGTPSDVEALRVENFCSPDFQDINFSVKKGEIYGLAGLVGAGRTETMEAIFGITKAQGSVYVNGERVEHLSVSEMKKRNIVFVTEDRKHTGIFANRSVRENLSVANLPAFVHRKTKHFGFKGEEEEAQKMVDKMNISIPALQAKISKLSGGNQQKVMIGRWLKTTPDIVILDEPTKGVDIGAKFEIHQTIVELAKEGAAVILVSSDLPELLSLSHRIDVMRSGHIVGHFMKEDFDSVAIIGLAASSSSNNEGVI